MSRVSINDQYLTDIGDGIREKLGVQTLYKPSQMKGAILSIPGASTLVSKTITQNGTYDPAEDNADGYSSVIVNVPSSQPNLQSKTATENGTVLPDAGYDGLSSVVVNVSGGGGDSYFKRLTPIHFDLSGGYIAGGDWIYGDTDSRADIYEVSQNKRYLIMLGADANNRLRLAFFTTDPANATGNISGTEIMQVNDPGQYMVGVPSISRIPFVSPSNGYIGVGKTNQNIDGVASYAFEIQF